MSPLATVAVAVASLAAYGTGAGVSFYAAKRAFRESGWVDSFDSGERAVAASMLALLWPVLLWAVLAAYWCHRHFDPTDSELVDR